MRRTTSIGIGEVRDDQYFITQVYAVDGKIAGFQRKRHLGEDEIGFTTATETAVFEHGATKFGAIICAESGPDFTWDSSAAAGASVLFLCSAPGLHGRRTDEAGWRDGFEWWERSGLGDARRHAARLGSWVAMATQSGSTVDEDFPGIAALIAPNGDVVQRLPDWRPGTLVVEIPGPNPSTRQAEGVPRRNRVDPWGDLHAVSARGMFTGNRGCVVDDNENVVRHHGSSLWIICLTEFRDWRFPLARPRRWTPLFFLDDAVALAAGHRPCATCRGGDYHSYQDAVSRSLGREERVRAWELNQRLQAERHRRGRGLARASDRIVWPSPYEELPNGAVVIDAEAAPRLVLDDRLLRFGFDGWTDPRPRPTGQIASVLTPPTSVAALSRGYHARLHPSAQAA